MIWKIERTYFDFYCTLQVFNDFYADADLRADLPFISSKFDTCEGISNVN